MQTSGIYAIVLLPPSVTDKGPKINILGATRWRSGSQLSQGCGWARNAPTYTHFLLRHNARCTRALDARLPSPQLLAALTGSVRHGAPSGSTQLARARMPPRMVAEEGRRRLSPAQPRRSHRRNQSNTATPTINIPTLPRWAPRSGRTDAFTLWHDGLDSFLNAHGIDEHERPPNPHGDLLRSS